MDGTIAPGARVLIRDEEWLVRRVDPSSDGGDLLVCDGVSELVRGRSAQFLTTLEDHVDVLDPAKTELVADDSNAFNASMLYIESVLRRNLPNDEAIRLGHRAVMNLVPYQLDPALQALAQPRQRILIADATWYDIHGRIVFTNSKGVVGVGLPRKGTRKEPPTVITAPDGKQQRGNHGWDDIKDTPDGTIIGQTVTDDILPNGLHQKVRRYEAPFTLANREADYHTAWDFFAQPAGEAMDVAAWIGRRL